MILLAIGLTLGMQAQVSPLLPPDPEPEPDVYPLIYNCPSGYKLQRYHQGINPDAAQIMENHMGMDPSGWRDMDGSPHEGDIRCKKKASKAAIIVPPPSGQIDPGMNFGAQTTPGPGLQFPAAPLEGTHWKSPLGDTYAYLSGRWVFDAEPTWQPAQTGMNACGPAEHLHPTTMSEFAPDIKGGPLPKADGRCHEDLSDLPVYPHGKRLTTSAQEAKR
jgi:hypothetical protein